jgi:hypothetical protein
MSIPFAPITRPRAALHAAVVVVALLAWVLLSETFGLGPLGQGHLALIVHASLTGLIALALVFIATLGDADRVASLGLSRPAWLPTVLAAMLGAGATYIVSAVVSGAAMLAMGGMKDVEAKARALAALGDIPIWTIAPIALFAGFYEEVVFRGFLLGRLRIVFGESRRGLAAAVVVSSLLFASGHAYQGKLGLVQTFAAGACLGVIAAVRRSLWPSIFAHAAIDLFGLFALQFLRPALEKILEHEGFKGFG